MASPCGCLVCAEGYASSCTPSSWMPTPGGVLGLVGGRPPLLRAGSASNRCRAVTQSSRSSFRASRLCLRVAVRAGCPGLRESRTTGQAPDPRSGGGASMAGLVRKTGRGQECRMVWQRDLRQDGRHRRPLPPGPRCPRRHRPRVCAPTLPCCAPPRASGWRPASTAFLAGHGAGGRRLDSPTRYIP